METRAAPKRRVKRIGEASRDLGNSGAARELSWEWKSLAYVEFARDARQDSPKVAFSSRQRGRTIFAKSRVFFQDASGFRADRKDSGERRKEVVAMRSFRLLLTFVVAGGMLAMSASHAYAQSAKSDVSSAAARMIAACQVVEEATLVQETLDRFDSGLAAHDIQQLQAAGIEPVSAKGWQRFFKSNPNAKVTDSCPVTSLFIAGDKALWNCTETSTITSAGKPMQYAHLIQFTFTKKDGTWMISDRR